MGGAGYEDARMRSGPLRYISTQVNLFWVISIIILNSRSRGKPLQNIQTQLRKFLIEARKQAGLTQIDLASALGKPQSFVSKYERGERRLDVGEFVQVTKALGVDAIEMLTRLIGSVR